MRVFMAFGHVRCARWESNPGHKHGELVRCHYTTSAAALNRILQKSNRAQRDANTAYKGLGFGAHKTKSGKPTKADKSRRRDAGADGCAKDFGSRRSICARWESNPGHKDGELVSCHYTTSAVALDRILQKSCAEGCKYSIKGLGFGVWKTKSGNPT